MPDINKNFQFFFFSSHFDYRFLGVSLLYLPNSNILISVRTVSISSLQLLSHV